MDFSVDLVEDLDVAIYNKDTERTREILSRYPDFLKNHELRHLPVIHAVLLDDDGEILELLIEFGADVNRHQPLEIALFQKNLQIIEILLKNGAKLKWEEDSPVSYVVRKIDGPKKNEILQLFLKYNLDTGSLLDEFAVHIKGTKTDPVQFAETLVYLGLSLNEYDKAGLLPFHHAIQEQNLELVSFLIRHGADVNKKTCQYREDCLPLHVAARGKSLDIVKKLVSRGAKIDAVDHDGWTALHVACCNKRDQIISFLIYKGADIRAKTRKNETPFRYLRCGPEDDYHECIDVMIKELAVLSFDNIEIPNEDRKLMVSTQKNKDFYLKCRMELFKMLHHKFYVSHNYYDVLKMSKNIENLAKLTKNEEFVNKFKKNLHLFPCYETDLRRVFDDAIEYPY